MVNPELLKILCCPETHQSLRESPAELVEDLNRQIAAGTLKNRAGKVVIAKLSGGLIRSDGKYLYPIREQIPIMLVDEAIPLQP
jgi:uncharacterized protein YbaR (Trm112 family)